MTRDIDALRALQVRLEGATEGSDDLDEAFAIGVGVWKFWVSKHRYWIFDGPGDGRFHTPETGFSEYDPDTGKKIDLAAMTPRGWKYDASLPDYTTSLDAAVALVEEVLPGEFDVILDVSIHGNDTAAAEILGFVDHRVVAETRGGIALALCMAAVMALIAQEEAG